MPAPVVVAEIVRSGFVEGHHYGSVVALDADGRVAWSVGDVRARCCRGPATSRCRPSACFGPGSTSTGPAGARVRRHSGEAFHLEGVRRILAAAGLDESALQTPPDYPIDDQAREEYIRAGGQQSSIAMNCSGKHAAMLATCVVNGWATDTYLDPDHPLQVAIAETFADLTGEKIEVVAVDGCGAPLLSTSLGGLARAFRTARSPTEGPERRVADAIRTHPEFTSGTPPGRGRAAARIPGAIGKAGAESCYAVGLPDGRAVALKTDDGAPRVRPVLMAAALERLGVTGDPGVDADAVRRTGVLELLGGGRPVGEIRATF